MESSDHRRAAIDDRRTAVRRESSAQVTVTFESGEFGGRAEDISVAGVFFFSPDRVRVRVEVVDNGVHSSFLGRLVRVEPVSNDSSGFAIEFDQT